MKILVMVKGDPQPGASTPEQDEQMFAAMGRYNEELVEAGIMRDGAGLKHSSNGHRIAFENGATQVIDGPFSETKELLAGFWVWEVDTMEEAITWARKAPMADGDTLELRPYHEDPADLGEGFTAELQEQEDRLREKLAAQQGG